MANELSHPARWIPVPWAPVGCLALAASALLLQLIELNDVFVRHEWVTRQFSTDPGGLVMTTVPADARPFLWPGDPQDIWVAAAVMLVIGLMAASLALGSLRRSRWWPGPVTVGVRVALAAGVAVGAAQLLYLSVASAVTASASICDTVRLLPWLELSALLGLVGASVGLYAAPPIGRGAGWSLARVTCAGGIVLGLGVAALTLLSSIVIMFSVIRPNCPN